jgi:hypothetical protein
MSDRLNLKKFIRDVDDFPIEQFLINKYSNYNGDKRRGKEAHASRVLITNFLAKQNLDRYIDY